MNRKSSLMMAVATVAFLVSFMASGSLSQEGGKGQKAGYVGSEICQGCHQEIYGAFKGYDPHWKNLADPKVQPQKKGCESCHGPGQKHADAGGGAGTIFSFKERSAKATSDACLSCHDKQKQFFQFGRAVHKLNAVGCNDCHAVHGPTVSAKLVKPGDLIAPAKTSEGRGRGSLDVHLLRFPETDLCLSCHQEVKGKFYLPTRHKVLEGAVKCTDCHTPHGTRTRASLKKLNRFNDDACFKCHPEKRGPWVFEHAPVKTEGCMVCHAPHGSPNRFLLIRRDVRTVCMECHGLPPHSGGLACSNCHTQIHGSNFQRAFLQ